MLKWIVKKPISVILFYVAILFIGLGALYNLPVELIPGADFPKVNISVSWPFTSPMVIESQVIAPMESEVQLIPGIRKISSVSETGYGTISMELNKGVNPDFFIFELQQKISVLREQLPSPYIRISIQKYIPEKYRSEEFMSFSMMGDRSQEEITQIFHKKVLPVLLSVKGVSHASLPMEQYRQLLIKIDQRKCEQYGIPFYSIKDFIRENDLIRYIGSIHIQNQQLSLLLKNQLRHPSELAEIIIESHKGRFIRLRDIATIVDTVTTLRYITRINGKNALLIRIQKEAGANSLSVSDEVTAKLENLEKELPADIHFIKESDQSDDIRENLRNLFYRSTISLLVIFLVLLFFLSDIKSPVIIVSSILFSILLTFIVFYLLGYTINLFSLAGLALGFGILVDNSIVVLEAAFHFMEKGYGKIRSIFYAVKEVRLPVIAASLTTIAALIPTIYLTGELKLYYLSFVRAVIISLLSSILVAFTLIPFVILVLYENTGIKVAKSGNTVSGVGSWVLKSYKKWLHLSFRHPRWIILLCILWFGLPLWKMPDHLESARPTQKMNIVNSLYNSIIVPAYNFLFDNEMMKKIRPTLEKVVGGTSYWFFKYVEIGEMWRWQPGSGYIGVYVSMPEGTDPAFTLEVMRQFEDKALAGEGVSKVRTSIWPGGGFMRVQFTDDASRSILPYLLKEKLIQLATNFAGFGVSVFGYGMDGYSSGYGSGSFASYLLELRGYNYSELESLARNIGNELQTNRRVRNVNINASERIWESDQPEEIVLKVNRKKMGLSGIRAQPFLATIQKYLQQENWYQKMSIGKSEIIFNIKEKQYAHFSIDDLKNTILVFPGGQRIRVGDVAYIQSQPVSNKIRRENQEYVRYISYEFIGPPRLGEKFFDDFVKSLALPPGYSIKKKDLYGGDKKQESGNVLWIVLLSVLFVYMVTAALFESYRQPFLILLSIPMAITGVFLIFYLTGVNFDQSAMIGVILLAGIVVNNAILLVYQVDRYRLKMDSEPAVILGAQHRVRPILMTTLTTILGMLPLVLLSANNANNADLWGNLALASIGGLITSTAFVLLAMPAILYGFTKGD